MKLTRGAVNVLLNYLASPGWATDVKSAYMAGSLLVNKLPDLSGQQPPVDEKGRPSTDALKKWLDEEFDVEFNPLEFGLCRKCLVHFISTAKNFSPNPHSFQLLKAFELTGE